MIITEHVLGFVYLHFRFYGKNYGIDDAFYVWKKDLT